MFCSLSLIFLSMLFLQSNTPMFVLQKMWSSKTLNLVYFGPRFLTFFKGFLTTYRWTSSSSQRLKSLQILALLGPRWCSTAVSISTGISFSPFFSQWPNWEHTDIQCNLVQICVCFLQPYWACNRNALYSVAGGQGRGSTSCFVGKPCLLFPPLIQTT